MRRRTLSGVFPARRLHGRLRLGLALALLLGKSEEGTTTVLVYGRWDRLHLRRGRYRFVGSYDAVVLIMSVFVAGRLGGRLEARALGEGVDALNVGLAFHLTATLAGDRVRRQRRLSRTLGGGGRTCERSGKVVEDQLETSLREGDAHLLGHIENDALEGQDRRGHDL